MDRLLDDNSKVLGEIYVITNIINEKQYVGQTLTHRLNHGKYRPFGYEGRFNDHISEALCNSKAKQCRYLNNAIRKNGKDSFKIEIIERCPMQNIDSREIYHIKTLNTLYPNGYNLTKGGKTLLKVEFEDTSDNKESIKQPRTQKRSVETKTRISSRLKEVLDNPETREHRMKLAQKQHLNTKLQRYENVELSDNLDDYIHPVVSKETKNVKFYKVIINGVVTRFRGKHMSTCDLKKQALEFLIILKNKSLATLPNCSGKP